MANGRLCRSKEFTCHSISSCFRSNSVALSKRCILNFWKEVYAAMIPKLKALPTCNAVASCLNDLLINLAWAHSKAGFASTNLMAVTLKICDDKYAFVVRKAHPDAGVLPSLTPLCRPNRSPFPLHRNLKHPLRCDASYPESDERWSVQHPLAMTMSV